MAGPAEDIVDAHAGEGTRFLAQHRLERREAITLVLRLDEPQLAVLPQLPELLALAFARRGRAFGGVEILPLAAQRGSKRGIGIDHHTECEERIGLCADTAGHFGKIDEVELPTRI